MGVIIEVYAIYRYKSNLRTVDPTPDNTEPKPHFASPRRFAEKRRRKSTDVRRLFALSALLFFPARFLSSARFIWSLGVIYICFYPDPPVILRQTKRERRSMRQFLKERQTTYIRECVCACVCGFFTLLRVNFCGAFSP